MTNPTALETASSERAKAFAAFHEAAQIYMAFQTLKPTGLVQLEPEERLSEAACGAAAEFARSMAAYNEARAKSREAMAQSLNALQGSYIPKLTPKPEKGPGTMDSVKCAIVAAQGRGVSSKVLKRILMEYGGRKNDGPSLRALPLGENAIRCVSEIEALPVGG
ncbi:MAG TPA: hypothetical protein VGJ21_10310 [Terracidiphilus sp.]|jgi:hypothetical protein